MLSPTAGNLRLFSREPKIKVLHFSWVAFFITFLVWFNHAPLMAAIRDTFALTKEQIAALLIMNVALTIPARIIVGILVDKLGPRLMYSALLAISGALCIGFALATSFDVLAVTRFLLGFVGAGFVVKQDHQRVRIQDHRRHDYNSRSRFRSDMNTSIAFVPFNDPRSRR